MVCISHRLPRISHYLLIISHHRSRRQLQVQLEQLTASFQNVTEDMRQRFAVDGQTVLDESIIGTSPIGSLRSGSLRTSFMKPSFGRSGELPSSGLIHPAGCCFLQLPLLCIFQQQQPQPAAFYQKLPSM